MKITHYLFVLIITFNSIASFAQSGITFEDISLEEAKTLATKENKLIFIDAYADWCGPCKWMVANTFTDAEVGTFFKENFISVQIDMESEIGMEFDLEYFVDAYPTLLILNSKGEITKRHTGALDATEFLRFGKITVDPSSSVVLQLKNKIDAGEKNEEVLSNYLIACLEESVEPESNLVDSYLTILEEKGKNDSTKIGEYLIEANNYERDVNKDLVITYFENLDSEKLIEDEPFTVFYFFQLNLDAPSTIYFAENFENISSVWGKYTQDKFGELIVNASEEVNSGKLKKEDVYSFIKLYSEYNNVDYEELKTVVDNVIEM